MDNKILIVYNTCGIRGDNTDWYIHCIKTMLDQNFDGHKIVLSSCLNSPECIEKIKSVFGDQIYYCIHKEAHTVNITFNKAVLDVVKSVGSFENYLYIDSGCCFEDLNLSSENKNQDFILQKLYNCRQHHGDGIISLQADSDEAFQTLDSRFKWSTSEVQITDEDYVIPVGKAINGHTLLFSHSVLEKFGKLIPDVFAAFCTESVLTFVCAAIGGKWVIMKDYQIHHARSVDGPSSAHGHWSSKFNNPWNNLLFDRNVLDFINDSYALEVGLGYEECNSIMMHNPDAYDSNGQSKYPEELSHMISKYFYSSNDDIDYNNMRSTCLA